MATEQEIKSDLIGDAGKDVSTGLVRAVQSLTDWPVDAFSVDLRDTNHQTVAWIHGNSIGELTGEGNFDEPKISGTVRPLRELKAIDVSVRVIDGFHPTFDRAIEARFGTGEPISVDVAKHAAPHYRKCANQFITHLLRAVSGPGEHPN